MKNIYAFQFPAIEAYYAYIGLLLVFMTAVFYAHFLVYMRRVKRRTVTKVKKPIRHSQSDRRLFVVAGSGAAAARLLSKYGGAGERVVHISDRAISLNKKNVTFIEGSLNGEALDFIGFSSGEYAVTVYCVYESDAENLNAALILNGALEKRLPSCGERKVRIAYNNIAKTQFFNCINNEIKYFNTDELTARFFLNKYNITEFLPKGRGAVNGEEAADIAASNAEGALEGASADNAGTEKRLKVRRIFVGFSNLNAEILEKLTLSEDLYEEKLSAVVFDKNADKLLPAFYERANDILDIEYLMSKSKTAPAEMIAFKIDAEAYELYEKIMSLCKCEDFCAVYIDISSPVVNTETALELRDTLIKNGVSDKAVIFAYNDSKEFIDGCGALNKGFSPFENIIFYGAFDIFAE